PDALAGPRSGELEALTVGDVSDHDLGKIIRVDGKTGQRDVTITNAVPYLRQWLNNHPAPDDDNAPLWSKLKKAEGCFFRLNPELLQG
ncbi:MAG: integrase, partial [Bacteroidetes bacterium QH_7_62_13]